MNINKSKMKVIECNVRKSGDAEGFSLDNEAIKVEDEFCYLGSKISSDGRSKKDIKAEWLWEEKRIT